MKDKTTTGILAILVGAYGAHWFYLGDKEEGKKYLLISLLTCGVGAVVMEIMSIIYGVKIFGMSDEEFLAEVDRVRQKAAEQGTADEYVDGDGSVKEDSPTVDRYEELKRAKALLDKGVLTEEEFSSIKTKILEG